MEKFILDTRLANDCIVLGKLDSSLLLLMDNSLIPWFILVPETSETEFIDLSHAEQARLLKEINLVSTFIREHFNCSKLNIGAIGNIVSQLHIHIIGRDPSDYCWPKVVWGEKEKELYSDEQIESIRTLVKHYLGDQFTAQD